MLPKRLAHPDDPFGIATLRKVLITLGGAILVIGLLRILVNNDDLLPYVLAAVAAALLGLLLEPLLRLVTRRN